MHSTSDPSLRSFVDVAADSDFPIQNLPFGCFVPAGNDASRVGVAIGDSVLDLRVLSEAGLLDLPELKGRAALSADSLAPFMALGRPAWRAVRSRLSGLLRSEEPRLRDDAALRARAFHSRDGVSMRLPCAIADYTDFYSSREHATNVGIMFRGAENALMPNWLHLPVAYHGRAGTVVVSGTDFHRPAGQTKADDAAAPSYGPSRALDFELEVAFLIGPGTQLGETVSVAHAWDHIFGFVLLNDWSARDLQRWEYQPLGPFLGKNFCTTLSPWVVTVDALEPFRARGPEQDPPPLPYLASVGERTFDLALEASIRTARMDAEQVISRTNFSRLYWDPAQQLAHHTVNGCKLRTGDLMASGTISGAEPDSRGSLLELAWKGTTPLTLVSGETRRYLEDGDELILRGRAERGGLRVGFGEARGRVVPALG